MAAIHQTFILKGRGWIYKYNIRLGYDHNGKTRLLSSAKMKKPAVLYLAPNLVVYIEPTSHKCSTKQSHTGEALLSEVVTDPCGATRELVLLEVTTVRRRSLSDRFDMSAVI
jgi:hypothetical protein